MQTLQERPLAVNDPAEVERLDRLAERETTIQYDDSSPTATIFTCHRALASRLLRLGCRPTWENRRNGRVESWRFTVPKAWVSVRPPRKGQALTPEEARRRFARKTPRGEGVLDERRAFQEGSGIPAGSANPSRGGTNSFGDTPEV